MENNTQDIDELPVVVFLNKEGRVYQAGVPSSVSGRDIAKAVKDGDTVKTVTKKEYLTLKWTCDAPAT